MTIPEERRSRKLYNKATLAQSIKEDGRLLIVYMNKVYDVTKFIKHHPGGQLAIRHMVGKDATGAINAFHHPDIPLKKMPYYLVGEYLPEEDLSVDIDDIIVSRIRLAVGENDDHDESFGGVKGEYQTEIGRDYLALHEKIRELGFYKPDLMFYARRALLFAVILASAVTILKSDPSSVFNVVVSALMIAFTWHGLAFSAHDSGHHSVTCNSKWDSLIGIFLADFIGGLSIGWWKFNHNVHHIVTNDLEHDPDIQHLPVIAVSSRFFDHLYSSFYRMVMKFDAVARTMVPLQHFLFIPLLTFGRFNLYARSIAYLLRSPKEDDCSKYRWLEISGICFFWFWYGYLLVYLTIPTWPLRLLFVWLSHAATFILHLQITLSHFAMSTEDIGDNESFAEKALRTTMNVDNPAWFDWFHGGLNFQIEHHLFPRIPRVHFRRLQPIIQDFCRKHDLKYHNYGFIRGNGIVLDTLYQVAQQIRFLVASADPSHRFIVDDAQK